MADDAAGDSADFLALQSAITSAQSSADANAVLSSIGAAVIAANDSGDHTAVATYGRFLQLGFVPPEAADY